MSRFWVLGLGVYLAACEATRNEPAPQAMCRELTQACEGIAAPGLQACYKIGAAGLKNARDEDQCYAVYDDCIADCRYFSAVPDAGDATVSDAAAEVTDSAVAATDSGAVTDSAANATDSAANATDSAANATDSAVDATDSAVDATDGAVDATASLVDAAADSGE
jgi:hypothetical protein